MSQDDHPGNGSHAATVVAVAIVAYAVADFVHEVVGHLLVAKLSGITALSISSVALQTVQRSRVVSAAGTMANIGAGVLAFVLLARVGRFDALRYFLWLFGFVSLMNSGYLVFSAGMNSGDWAVVIGGLNPSWAWRIGLAVVGVVLYAIAIRVAASATVTWLKKGELRPGDLPRLTWLPYLAGGVLMVTASAFNPAGLRFILVSGIGGSFGLTWGLILLPRILADYRDQQVAATNHLRLERPWIALAVFVAIGFIAVFGPGIRLTR